MSVHKIIFRLDFEPNFQIMDSPGEILRLLYESGGGKDWPELGETKEKRAVTGKCFMKEKGWNAAISIEPVAISGHVESIPGLPLDKLEDTAPVSRFFKTANRIRKKFIINQFKRTGFRIFLFETEKETGLTRDTCQQAFRGLYHKELLSALQNQLGDFEDAGMAFDGIHEDAIQYHFKWGPYRNGELRQYLQQFDSIYKHCSSDPFPHDEDMILTLDIDFFETDHSISESMNLTKWCGPMIERTLKLRKELFEILKIR